MDDKELDEIERRCLAATPGPWDNTYSYAMANVFKKQNDLGVPIGQCVYCGDDNVEMVKQRKTYHVHRAPHASSFGYENWHKIHNSQGVTVAGNFDYEDGGIISEADADFIAAARQDVPKLVAEVRRLRAELRKAQPFKLDA